MPVYEYKAFDDGGKRIAGIVDAESPAAARQKLRASRVFPIAIEEAARPSDAAHGRPASFFLLLFGRVRASDIAVATRGLATLVAAGFPLVGALEALVFQIPTAPLKKVMIKVKDLVVEGNSFAAALSQFPAAFPPLYVNLVQAGEASGTLEIVLERLADMMENQLDLSGRIKSALTYPAFMAILGTAVLFFLMTVIVPSIAAVFSEMGRALPAPTRLLIAASDFIQSFWWLILFFGLGALVLAFRIKRTPQGREWIHRLILRLPVAGSLATRLSTARFARTLGSLLENGIPMLQALDIVQNVVGYTPILKAVQAGTEEVGKGSALAEALASHAVFPPSFSRWSESASRVESWKPCWKSPP